MRMPIAILAGLGTAGAALTGFYGDWVAGELTGRGLLAHLVFAAAAMVGLALWSLSAAAAHRLGAAARGAAALEQVRRGLFWLLLTLALVTMATMLSVMFPIFGYIGQHELTEWHERSGLGVVIVGVLYLLLPAAARRTAGEKSHAP